MTNENLPSSTVSGVMECRSLSHVRLCDPMDCSPPGSSVHGILQARYWSGFPFPSPGYLSKTGIEPRSPELQVYSLPLSHQGNSAYMYTCGLFILLYRQQKEINTLKSNYTSIKLILKFNYKDFTLKKKENKIV